jgi:hypothetical protein
MTKVTRKMKSRTVKRPWEPMRLTSVGNLAAVITSMAGSVSDGNKGLKNLK